MWIFKNDAMVSLVADRTNASNLLVRARAKGDIERIFGAVPVLETHDADYRFRSSIDRAVVAAMIAASVLGIEYDNFKNSVDESDRHDAYLSVWNEMLQLQDDRHGFSQHRFDAHLGEPLRAFEDSDTWLAEFQAQQQAALAQ